MCTCIQIELRIFKHVFTYLFERERESSSTCWFILQVITLCRAGPVQNQQQGCPLCLHVGAKSPSALAIISCFPRQISRELDRKCSNRNQNWCSYEILILQAATLPATPQSWPNKTGLKTYILNLLLLILFPVNAHPETAGDESNTLILGTNRILR